ncbi:MAG: GreA/GreB family elongation factor [Bacilli bacterium]|nr:GreA/GreB family elongation factor [Bacilli bacterium]
MQEEQIWMTVDGMLELEARLRHLIDVEQPDVIAALTAARAQGDLSENADYDAARDRQARIEEEIKDIEHKKDIAVVVISREKSEELKANLANLKMSLSNPDLADEERHAVEGKIEQLQRIVNVATIAPSSAFIDDVVSYEDLSDGTEHTVGIVGTVSADPMAEPLPLISDKCPLGVAIIGSLPGDEKEVKSVKGYKIKILTVEKGKVSHKK